MVTMLVTRPEPEASVTAARLRALDIEPLVEPLLTIRILDTSLPFSAGFAALAVTSANALRALARRGDLAGLATLPVYAVGDRTAAIARDFGFSEVISARGNVADLVSLLARAGVRGPVLYPSALQPAADLPHALAAHGVMTIAAPVYAMEPARALSSDASRGRIDAALFYSRRTAEAFVRLAADMPWRDRLGVLCLSENVAEPLIAAHFVRVSLADQPSEEAMLAMALSFARDQNPA